MPYSGGGGGGGGGSSSSGGSNVGQSSGQSTTNTQGTSSSSSSANAISDQIAAYAAQLATSQEQWGQNQYAATSAVTNNSIDNYLAASQQDMNLANQTQQQYEQTTVPEITQQANEAAQYSSPSRIGINMGSAESQSMQGSNAALQAAKQNLQSSGIDPSSGMYQELVASNKTAAGAAAAGAGQQSELATEATGRQLLASAIATGQQLPGQAINASNAGTTAITGSENAALANANTGVALTDTGPASLISSAPNLAPNSQSQSQNTTNSQSTNQSTNYGSNSSSSVTNPTKPMNPTYSPPAPQQQPATSGGYALGGEVNRSPGGFSFATGGDSTQGGHVSQSASPSGGINVDDVPANLNSEEFVVPRDVARWKGEEFFHKMIDQSRMARTKAAQTVGPTAGPPQQPGQQPTFDSQSAQQPQAARGGSIQRFAAGGATSTDAMGSWGSSLNQSGLSGVAGGGYNSPSASPTASSATTTPTNYGGPGNVMGGTYLGQQPVPTNYGEGAMRRGGSIRQMYRGGRV